MGMAAICLGRDGKEVDEMPPDMPCARPVLSGKARNWFGTTSKEFTMSASSKSTCPGPGFHWSNGEASAFQVRCGPNYTSKKGKIKSAASLYDCIGVDVVRAGCSVKQVLGRLIPVPTRAKECWRKGCPLPRILCIVTQLPHSTAGPTSSGNTHDPGCSVVAMFAITKEAVLAATQASPPAAVRMLRNFMAKAGGPCPEDASTTSTGVVKAIAIGENVDDVGIPVLMKPAVARYNGTPTLITRSGTTHRDPAGEWLEVDIDVRYWAYAARSALYHLRGCMPAAVIHLGFLIQATEDADLPEGIIGACRVYGLDIMQAPVDIDDPAILAGR
mmetsp:Transcript_35975/g.84291  ORF Transcript_35975/g.84291 Transcript_35975/m.84291 type:complete len:330 (-) Transcript_35975:97-1086(-)